jgi:hypothetical protein
LARALQIVPLQEEAMEIQIHRIGDLEIDQDLKIQKRMWRIQRGGWIFLATVVLAAFFGFISPGLFSQVRTTDPSGLLTIQFDRYIHHQAPTLIKIEASPKAVREGRIGLWLSKELYEDVKVENVEPEPASVDLAMDRHYYNFTSRESTGPLVMTLRLEPDHPGWIKGKIGIDDTSVEVNQFVYP